MEYEGRIVPQYDAERATIVISSLCGGGEVVLLKLAAILHVSSPEVKMSAPFYDVISRP